MIFFLNSANLIFRGTDISKFFRESFGIRDNDCIQGRIQRRFGRLIFMDSFWQIDKF